MNHLLRLAGCAAFAGLLMTGGFALRPDLFVDLDLDWCDWPDSLQQCNAESERTDELARCWQTAECHTQTKDRICRELIDGGLTLAEATRQFMELPGTTEAMWQGIRSHFAGATPEESMSRRVIVWAFALLEKEPARAVVLRRRLQAELNRQYPLDD